MKKMDATWKNITKELEQAQVTSDEAAFCTKKLAADINHLRELIKIRKEYDETNHVVK